MGVHEGVDVEVCMSHACLAEAEGGGERVRRDSSEPLEGGGDAREDAGRDPRARTCRP
jgi:hypothetical protein